MAHGIERAYFQHFEQFRRKLRKLEDFNFVPLEVPSRDVGRALIEYLNQHTSPVLVVEPRNWSALAAQVLALPTRDEDPRPVLIFGPRDWVEQLPRALNLLNQQRDTIGRHLQRPLIWCGLHFFLEVFWDHAPDFWSIRNVTTQIPLDDEPQVPLTTTLDPFAQSMTRITKPHEKKFYSTQAFVSASLEYVRWLVVQGRAHEAVKPLHSIKQKLPGLKKGRTTVEEATYYELDADVASAVEKPAAAQCCHELALAGHRDTGDALAEARVLAKLGRVEKQRGNANAAQEHFDTALQSADALADSSLRAAILHARACDPSNTSERRRALVDLDQAIGLFDSIGDNWGLARALVTRSSIRFKVDDKEGAVQDLDRALPMLSFDEDPIAWTNGHVLRVALHYLQSEYGQAKKLLEILRKKQGYAKQRTIRAWTLMLGGMVLRHLREYTAAEKRLTEAINLLVPEKLASWRADAYLERSIVRSRMMKWTLAEHDARVAKGLSSARHRATTVYKFLEFSLHSFHEVHADLLRRMEKFNEALESTREALELAANESNRVRSRIFHTQACIRVQKGDLEEAWNDWEQGLALLREIGSASDEVDMLVERAVFLASASLNSKAFIDRLDQDLWRVVKDLRAYASQRTLIYAHALHAHNRFLVKKFDEARRMVDKALALGESHAEASTVAAILMDRYRIDRAVGDHDAAQTDLKRIVALGQSHDDLETRRLVTEAKALLAEYAGDVEHALHILHEMRDAQKSSIFAQAQTNALMAQIQHRRHRPRAAQKLANKALSIVRDRWWRPVIEREIKDIISDSNP